MSNNIKQLERQLTERQQTIERLMDEVGRAGSILGLDFTKLSADAKNPLSDKAQEVMQQLAEEKAARKEAESEANANEEELAMVEELLYQSRQRIEQLEERIEKARELVQKWRQEATEPDSSFAGVWLPVAAKELEAALAQPQEADHG